MADKPVENQHCLEFALDFLMSYGEEPTMRTLLTDAVRWRMARRGDGEQKWLDLWDEEEIDAAIRKIAPQKLIALRLLKP